MGKLDKPALDALIAAGCPGCGGSKLTFQTYVDGLLPLMGGEPIGKLKWVYNGEKFLDGVYEVTCADCERAIFTSADCPRCHAEGTLKGALETENQYPVPMRCPRCENDEVRYIAFLPATATYEGKRANPARTDVDLYDPGFHGYRVDCKTCGKVGELKGACPVCGVRGVVRERPE